VIRPLLVGWGLVVGAAALWTGAQHGFHVATMTGFLPPHYGYSAYALVPLLFLGPRWAQLAGGAALLLSKNRAAWVGAVVGLVWNAKECRPFGCYCERRLRAILAAGLVVLAVVGGNMLKPRGADGDSVRVHIWKAAAWQAWTAPGEFCIGVDGRVTMKAHSDVLQLAAERGWKVAALVLLFVGWAFYRLPEGPEKAVVAALSVQSVIDNRLHHPACAALFALAWLAAVLSPYVLRPRRTP
jgi:hypothetical protein